MPALSTLTRQVPCARAPVPAAHAMQVDANAMAAKERAKFDSRLSGGLQWRELRRRHSIVGRRRAPVPRDRPQYPAFLSTTFFSGWPAAKWRRFSFSSAHERSSESSAALATWGVTTTFGIVQSG